MNVSDIKIRIKRIFGDEAGVQITDEDILRWINDGQRSIVRENESLLQKTALSNAVAGTSEYDPPDDLYILRKILYKSSSINSHMPLQGLHFNEYNEYITAFIDTSNINQGVPLVFTTWAEKIILFPTPSDNSTNGIKIYYNRAPVDVSDNTDEPDLPALYHDAIVKYCLAMAYELDEDPEMSDKKSLEIEKDLATLRGRTEWDIEDYYPTITVAIEDLW